MAQEPLVDQGLPIIEASRSHSNTPHSAGLLWTSDQLVEDNAQHTQETVIHAPPPPGTRTHNPSKGTAADPRHRPRAIEIGKFTEYLTINTSNVISFPVIHILSTKFVRSTFLNKITFS
jgi:hypothetical protein